MTDYERTTTRETTTQDPVVVGQDPVTADPIVSAPATAASVRTTERAYVPAGPSTATTIAKVVTLLFGILQALLILRIILLLLVADHDNTVVALILNITQPFVAPFEGMFKIDHVKSGASVFDVAALVALVGWTLIEMLILAVLRIFDRRSTATA
jgi:uncharacterized protein YggT (Ycf19 family)